MKIVNIYEAKTNFSKLIEQVLAGEEVIIGKAGKPVVKVVKYTDVEELPKREPGALKGKIWIADDFDDEDEEINAMFYESDLK